MNEKTNIPHLATAFIEQFQQTEQIFLQAQATIETWFREAWRDTPAPFYASVDLRNAGYKIAPIDTNLFPAGFNNLDPKFEPLCIQAIQMAVEHLPGNIDKILIIPENHTRNLFYLENIASLQSMLEKAGFKTRIGSLMSLEESQKIELESSRSVLLEPVLRDQNRLRLKDFEPELILLNNDLAAGKPEILENIEQTITPPLALGWSSRLKSDHFNYYQQVAQEFATLIGIDPWLIDPLFRNCGEVDFMKREGVDCLTKNVTALLEMIHAKYDEHQLSDKPFVMVKADSGTYGMGIMPIYETAEIIALNRKQRTRMATTKEGQKVTKVIIQEGVYTHETWGSDAIVAEPVLYLLDHQVVGGFYRVHSARSTSENLNAPGMGFKPLAFADCCILPDPSQGLNAHQNQFYMYGVIARLALLAAAREIASVA